MNAMVTFRANGEGTYSPTEAQRRAAQENIVSTLRAKLEGATRQTKSASVAKAATTTAAKSNAAASAAKTDSTTSTSSSNSTLDKDAFLQLLVEQMKNQDPTSPMDSTQMISQLAQFSSLEQMTNLNTSVTTMNTSVTGLSGNMDQLNFISAQSLLGQQVTGLDSTGVSVSGKVDAVGLSGSIVTLTVGGKIVPMTNVTSISTAAASSAKAKVKSK